MHWAYLKQDNYTTYSGRLEDGACRVSNWYEPAPLSPCLTMRVLSFSDCQRSSHSISKWINCQKCRTLTVSHLMNNSWACGQAWWLLALLIKEYHEPCLQTSIHILNVIALRQWPLWTRKIGKWSERVNMSYLRTIYSCTGDSRYWVRPLGMEISGHGTHRNSHNYEGSELRRSWRHGHEHQWSMAR